MEKRKGLWKQALVFTLWLIPVAIVGGYFTGIYALGSYTKEMQDQIIAEIGNTELLYVITAVQTVGYALFCGFLGYLLAEAIGLNKPFQFKQKSFIWGILVGVIAGVALGTDYWTFGAFIPEVAESYHQGITVSYLIACILYGGIIEEIMLRWFMMSLLAFLLWKIFWKNKSKEEIPEKVFIIANIISALLFAAGHLPATTMMFGGLTPLILLRCFLLNGVFGFAFGEMYRKFGIQYAMLGHMGAHIVSKIIWALFIG